MRIPFSFWSSGSSPPSVASISPEGGPTTGGTAVTITGTHFTGQTSAKVGGVALTSFVVVNDTTITGVTGAGMPAGFGDVQVGTSGVPSTILKYAFCTLNLTGWWRGDTYNQGLGQWNGAPSGGNSGLTSHRVSASSGVAGFGPPLNGQPVLNILTTNGFASTNTPPPDASAFVDYAAWSFWALIDTSSITTDSSPNVLSNNCVIRCGGDGFFIGLAQTGPSLIPAQIINNTPTIKSVAASGVSLSNWHLLQCRYDGTNLWARVDGGVWQQVASPQIEAGALNGAQLVIGDANYSGLTAQVATSQQSFSDDQFDQLVGYVNQKYGLSIALPPSVSSITPNLARASGGQSAVIAGVNLYLPTAVKFVNGGTTVNAPSFTPVDPSTIDVTLPALASGTWDVVVVCPGGTATGAGLLTTTTVPITYSISPTSGSDAGGTGVTLTGANYTGTVSGDIGGNALTGISVGSDTSLTATTGASGSDGSKPIHITNGAGTGTGPATFTYNPSFDPSTLTATELLKASFTALPWIGTASAGTSGSEEQATKSGNNPTAGAAVNGFTPAVYDGTGGSQQNSEAATNPGGSSIDIASIISATAYTVMFMVYVDSAAAYVSGTTYQNATILAGDARFGIYFATVAGAGQVGVYHYNGSFPDVKVPLSFGAWHFVCVRWDSTSGNVQIDVDSTPGTPTALASFAALSGVPATTGFHAFNSGTSYKFRLMERVILQSKVSDSTRDSYKGYLNGKFGMSF